jgi:LDH2 family malate/lactate/ureidoglycolate dehydrogenase
MVNVEILKLRNFIDDMILAVGCDEASTEIIGLTFLEAHLRGIDHHGLDYMPKFIEAIQSRKIDPNGVPRVVTERQAHIMIDGNRGPGQLAGMFAAKAAVRKSRECGCAMVGITNSSDVYMLGYFVEQMARQGIIGLIFSASPPAAHAYGGIDKVIGTNPLAISFPTGSDNPFLLDMATTAWARASVREASYHNRTIPEGVAISSDGIPTTNPLLALEGAMSPLGGAKGFGLAMCVAFLSGPLVGSNVGKVMSSWNDQSGTPPGNKGHLLIGIDPNAFGDADVFRKNVDEYIEEVKTSKPAAGFSEVCMPGERTFQRRSELLDKGYIEVDEPVWKKSLKLANSLGVGTPT